MMSTGATGIDEQPPEERQYREQGVKKQPGTPSGTRRGVIWPKFFASRVVLVHVYHAFKAPVRVASQGGTYD